MNREIPITHIYSVILTISNTDTSLFLPIYIETELFLVENSSRM